MAASWDIFIDRVSSKLESQSIGSYEEMADFLRKEYISATVGKAASPYGQKHIKGNDDLIFNGFKNGLKILFDGGDLTFEEKKTSPEYADLDVKPPTVDVSESADQVDLDFRDWTEENKSSIPPFTYSQFFSQFPNFPETKEQAVVEIAKKILNQFDGTSAYIQWMSSLRTGSYSNWGNAIMDEVSNILRREVERPLQLGDSVTALVKYSPVVDLSSINSGYFDLSTGDVDLDNTDIFSKSYDIIVIDKKKISGFEKKQDIVNGKISSIEEFGGQKTIKVSFFSKKFNRNFIREVIPSTVNRKIYISDVTGNLPSVSISDRIFQEQHRSNPSKIPDYLTANFITNFTYSKSDSRYLAEFFKESGFNDTYIKELEEEFEEEFSYGDNLINFFGSNNVSIFSSKLGNLNGFSNPSDPNGIFRNIQNRRENSKILQYLSEEERYRNLRIRWIEEIAENARKQEDPDKPEDGYNVMAKGIIDYWKSCGSQPLTKEPGAPPCLFSPPQGGVYVPIYYGSQTMLGNNIKRAFNSGKRFNQQAEKKIASITVASALAYSFSMHLLDLKFIYRGGIPGPNGPVSMIGFVPLVY
jgi:hypothetical protein